MQILIDMDNVVADLLTKWLNIYNTTHNDCLTAEQITNWQIDLHVSKCSPEQFYNLIETPGFFNDLEVMPGAVEVTKNLQSKGHKLYFVTATPYNSPTAGYDKYTWVEKYFPHIGRECVIQAHHKYMIKGDVLFDDGPQNLQDFQGIKIAMDFPYNKHVGVNYRVKTWDEFEEVIDRITKFSKNFTGE